MTIPFQVILAIGRTLQSLSKESPLDKHSRTEYEIAVARLKSISLESNTRECLNSSLIHLESAFGSYEPKTWDIWDKDRALWSKRTFKNSICILISIIHYLLGNQALAKQWLEDNLTDMGHIIFPAELLKELSIPDEDTFFDIIGCKETIKSLEASIDWNYRCVYDLDDHSEPSALDNFY